MSQSQKRAHGHAEHGKSKAIAIRFSPRIFERIADEAEANGLSFSSQVRVFIGLGMACAAANREDAA